MPNKYRFDAWNSILWRIKYCEISKTFKRYAKSYETEIIDSKDSLAELEASKLSIKDLFKGFNYQVAKGFKYQVTVKFLLKKHKDNGDIEFSLVYFNSKNKTVINVEYMLDKSFQEILYRKIENWINERSGWVIESIKVEYVNISIFSPLSGSSYIKLPNKLRNSMEGFINIKSNDNRCFLWYHIRHLNPLKQHPERTTKADEKMVNNLSYEGIELPFSKKGNDLHSCIFLWKWFVLSCLCIK